MYELPESEAGKRLSAVKEMCGNWADFTFERH